VKFIPSSDYPVQNLAVVNSELAPVSLTPWLFLELLWLRGKGISLTLMKRCAVKLIVRLSSRLLGDQQWWGVRFGVGQSEYFLSPGAVTE